MPITIDEMLDREAIRHTIASYNKAGDANDADGFAECFTEDGLMRGLMNVTGREGIREWKSKGAAPALRIHYLAASHIEFIDADHAKVRTPWMVVGANGPNHCGLYNDVLRREGDGWLIEDREIDSKWRVGA